MLKSKLFKGIIMGIGISLLSTGAAFASESGGGKSPDTREPLLIEDQGVVDSWEPSEKDRKPLIIDESVLLKQKEVDQYVFTDNVDKMKEMGFSVVYTGPADSYVEIGIMPFKEEYADFLYEVFGKDSVRVVEGEQAILYTTTASGDDLDAPISNDSDERFVGDDMILEDGEFGIVSIDLGNEDIDPNDAAKMAESGIAEPSEEKDYEDNIAETTGVEITEDLKRTNSNNNSSMFIIVALAGGAILVTGVVAMNKKKLKK